MKTINDLKDELSIQFGTLMTGLTPGELDLILTFILTSFAYDFPEVGSRLYILPTTGSFRLYLDSIHDEFLEMKYMIPKQRVSGIAKSIYDNISSFETLFTEIDELNLNFRLFGLNKPTINNHKYDIHTFNFAYFSLYLCLNLF